MIDTYWIINTDAPWAREQARNIAEMHRNVCTMLGSTRADAGALWALDDMRTLIIRSHDMPDVNALDAAMIDKRRIEPLLTFFASAPVPDSFEVGSSHLFQLTANTIKRNFNAKRDTPVRAEDWLSARAARNGFRIEQMQARQFRACGGRAGKTILLSGARYTGELTVTDADAFRHLMLHGIGHGKAYGMGMMTLG